MPANGSRFSWKQLYDAALVGMDYMCWLIYKHQDQAQFLQDLLAEEEETPCESKQAKAGVFSAGSKLPAKLYTHLRKLFDYCKFMLHNFDQSLFCAWPTPRAPIDKAMRRINEELANAVKLYYMMTHKSSNRLRLQLLKPLNKDQLEFENRKGLNPLKPRLWKKQRAILGAERYTVFFPLRNFPHYEAAAYADPRPED